MSTSGSTSMHISLFVHSLRGGGAEKMMVQVANELHRRNHDVKLVLVHNSGPYESLIDPSLSTREIGGGNTLTIQYNLWRHLRRNETDVLLSTMEIPNIVSVIATRTMSTPVVLRIASIHSMREREGKYRLIPYLKRLVYPRAEAIVSISDAVGRDVAEGAGVNPEKITTVYNPAYDPKILDMAREPVDHDWLNDPEKRVVITVGNMKPAKDFPTLLRAVARLQDQEETFLILLGEGDGKEQLTELAHGLGISDRVLFPGFVDNPHAYVAKADVFALSSAWEGFGNVIVEAMACGTPVVCTDCPGGPAEILENGTYGPLVPVGDDKAMARAVRDQLADPTDPDLLQSRAREFSIERIVDEYETIIHSVVD